MENQNGYEPAGAHVFSQHSSTISAKLFCKRSELTFIPYGIVLKDERRTY